MSDLNTMRHSAAHVLAAAVAKLFPEAKFGVGPVVDNGFYYDVLVSRPLSTEDFKALEAEMKNIIKFGLPMRREEMGIDEAIEFFKARGQDFKVELLQDLKTKGTTSVKPDEALTIDVAKPDTASLYWTGDFVDLCRGPHLETTKEIGAFKLDRVAAAYWRGNQENPQLQRIYGLCFATKEDLKEFERLEEEAKKRDHRKIGQEMDLFTFSELVGSGLPLWTPKGTVIRNELDNYVWQLRAARGFEKVTIPHITKKDLYETSGHWQKFSEELFKIQTREGKLYCLKPMNCPHHT
ncbi:MAG: threonine--tRNA ligase, partial [bacterium]